MPTLRDIAAELIKPGRDPREDGSRLMYSDDVTTMDDLRPGMKLKGTVSNVTNFGAFVDIGVHQDGLVHISELSDQFVTDAAQVVAVGDVIEVRVLEVDKARKRISLSCKSERPGGSSRDSHRQGGTSNNRPAHASGGSKPAGSNAAQKSPAKPKAPEKSYTLDDLMSKFGRK